MLLVFFLKLCDLIFGSSNSCFLLRACLDRGKTALWSRLLSSLGSPLVAQTDKHLHLESLTVPWMSIPLHSMSRQHKDQRLDNRTYRLALMRRLRLPLLPPSLVDTNCTCGKPLDPFGDHIFSCPNAHKGKLSNAIRDTNAHLLRTLAPLAAFTDSPDSVTIETPQLAPSDLRKRPADVGMHLVSVLPTTSISSCCSLRGFGCYCPCSCSLLRCFSIGGYRNTTTPRGWKAEVWRQYFLSSATSVSGPCQPKYYPPPFHCWPPWRPWYLRPQILFRPRSSQSPWPDPIPTPWPQRCPSLCSSLWPSCSHWLIPMCWRKLDSVTPFHSLRSLLPYQPSQSLGPTISWSQSHCSAHYTPILPSPLSWIPPPPP